MIVAIAVARLIEVELDTSRSMPPLVVQAVSDEPEQLEGLGIEAADPTPRARVEPEQAVVAAAPAAEPAPSSATYVVEPGDSLSVISRKVYGTSRHWKAILLANKDRVPRPEALRTGTELRIPPAPR
ncbi:MAG: LysM peptidoglycan-binding domain-containing protein [Planctomycetota bacterium]